MSQGIVGGWVRAEAQGGIPLLTSSLPHGPNLTSSLGHGLVLGLGLGLVGDLLTSSLGLDLGLVSARLTSSLGQA